MRMDKYLKRLRAFQRILNCNLCIYEVHPYMNIFDMLTMILYHRNEKKINQKFVLLKVASDKKFGQHFP